MLASGKLVPNISTDCPKVGVKFRQSAAEPLSSISEPVRKCLRALEAAETDTEKFATLFLVPKLVRGSDCDKTARLYLMKVSSTSTLHGQGTVVKRTTLETEVVGLIPGHSKVAFGLFSFFLPCRVHSLYQWLGVTLEIVELLRER